MPNTQRKNHYFSPQAKARLDAVLKKASTQVKLAIQEGVNDFAESVAVEASIAVDSGVEAIGPNNGEIQSNSNAMSTGYYWVKYHNGSVTSNYEQAKQAAIVSGLSKGDDYRNETMPKGSTKAYAINERTTRLQARVGNATKHGVYWEEGHMNQMIGSPGVGVFSQAPVLESLMAKGGRNGLVGHINKRLRERNLKTIGGKNIK